VQVRNAEVGWIGIAPADTMTNANIIVAGYPGDKPFGTQWTSRCKVTDDDPTDYITLFDCDIYGGTSGGPAYEQGKVNEAYIRAIVTFTM